MTDEDSDERLDRAERIRRMREGRSSRDDGTDDGTDPSDGTDATDNEGSTGDDASDEDDGGEDDNERSVEEDSGEDDNERSVEEDSGKDSAEGSVEDDSGAVHEEESVDDDQEESNETDGTPDDGVDGGATEIDASVGSSADTPGVDASGASGDGPTAGSGAGASAPAVGAAAGGGTAGGGAESGAAAATQVSEDMTAAEIARALDQGTESKQQAAGRAGFGRGSVGEDVALQAGSITGETIVDDSFFTEGGRAQIIEFSIDGELFAIDVGYVGEIIETPEVTRMPNTPDCVQGVVDLRGKVTAVMDPAPVIASEASLVSEALIVVLDGEALSYDGTVGWLVDDVRQVATISDEQVTDPPEGDDWVRGIVDRDDEEFVIWTDPTTVLDEIDTTDIGESVDAGE